MHHSGSEALAIAVSSPPLLGNSGMYCLCVSETLLMHYFTVFAQSPSSQILPLGHPLPASSATLANQTSVIQYSTSFHNATPTNDAYIPLYTTTGQSSSDQSITSQGGIHNVSPNEITIPFNQEYQDWFPVDFSMDGLSTNLQPRTNFPMFDLSDERSSGNGMPGVPGIDALSSFDFNLVSPPGGVTFDFSTIDTAYTPLAHLGGIAPHSVDHPSGLGIAPQTQSSDFASQLYGQFTAPTTQPTTQLTIPGPLVAAVPTESAAVPPTGPVAVLPATPQVLVPSTACPVGVRPITPSLAAPLATPPVAEPSITLSASPTSPVSILAPSPATAPPPAPVVNASQDASKTRKRGPGGAAMNINALSKSLLSSSTGPTPLTTQILPSTTAALPVDPPISLSNALNKVDNQLSDEVRRSGRPVIPSKRCEVTPITSATPKSNEKENIPPNTPPEWAVQAKNHLLIRDLSDEWNQCVEVWIDLEGKLGYGCQTGAKVMHHCSYVFFFIHVARYKGPLPAASDRPEEWNKWALKTRHGVRQYQSIPPISDPHEFGIAIVKWWNAMQPELRKSETGMPKPIYTINAEAWGPLLRSGPNGLVSVLTLVVWWGHALEARSRWQEDSGPLWTEMVEDLLKSFECLKSVSQLGKKRKVVTSGKENTSKKCVFLFFCSS